MLSARVVPAAQVRSTRWACCAAVLLAVLLLAPDDATLLLPAATARALSTNGLDLGVARWFVAEDTLPPELLADTYNPDISMGDVIGTFHDTPDNTQYWDTHW